MNENKNEDMDFDFGGGADFNPENIEVEETINAVFVLDKYSSMGNRVGNSTRIDELNSAVNIFVEEMSKSHLSDRLLVSTVVFDHEIEVLTGFQPITEVEEFRLTPGGMTALYGAARVGLDKAIDYRDNLIKSGIKAKTVLFLVTDGENVNSPDSDADYVKAKLEELNKEEQNIMTFSAVLLGIGDDGEFKKSFDKLGFHGLAEVGDDIRKVINILSSSVTSVSNGQNVSQKINF